MTVSTDQTLADIVTAAPASARVLESFDLDYCCGGRRTLADSCGEKGLDPHGVVAAIAEATAGQPGSADWASMGPIELVDHLVSTHHLYLHNELGRLDELAAKVSGVHGARHPELLGVASTYAALREDLEPHLIKEERMLFPMIRELAASEHVPDFHCGTLGNPISVMMTEHDRAGELLAQLRVLTGDYIVPDDGCASYRALYEGLAELERDTHLHVHKENNLLFPSVIDLETRLAGAAT